MFGSFSQFYHVIIKTNCLHFGDLLILTGRHYLFGSDAALTTFDNSVLRLIFITSIFMFMQNKSSHLLQSQLTELIDSHSRSSELVRIMNKFSVGMPRDKIVT